MKLSTSIYPAILCFALTATSASALGKLSDPQSVSVSVISDDISDLNLEGNEEILIFDSEEERLQWMEEQGLTDDEFYYIDEEGNEYMIFSEEVADASGKKPTARKKGVRAQKRNCNVQSGGASWYGPGFHGRKTANGETFNQNALTAASKTIRFNSIVRVTYKGRSVDVRINDAGPYVGGRVIDLSKAAAAQIGLIGPGHGQVTLTLIKCG